MSLPEKIRVYLILDVKANRVVFATHDAELAVLVKKAHVEQGGTVDILPMVSMRRPNAEGQTEHRCFGCPTPHTVYVEASSAWSSRMFETPCDDIAARAAAAEREMAWRFN